MRDAPVAGQDAVPRGERVEGRCGGVAENGAAHLVLEHDHDHVVEGRHRSGRSLGARKRRSGQGGGDGNDGPAAHDGLLSARRSRFFQTW